ncbi:Endonuclease/exonuclease/phosphatase [Dipodascopsis uninucleata]
MMLPNWQQQIHLAQLSRQSGAPHHHARAAAAISRGVAPPAGLALHDISMYSNAATSAATLRNYRGAHTRMESSDAEQVERVQGTDNKEKRQDWAALDMGGQGLRNLSISLFNYQFLDKLYINHNRLTTLPAAIGKLNQLSILDLSGNLLSALPAEIGLIVNLKMLLLFDNNIHVLPPELGLLYKLDVLGIEGNPLPESTKTLMAKEGTKGVVVDLRDNSPVPANPPPPRDWIVLEEKDPDKDAAEEGIFTVATYNILCDKYAYGSLYGYTPSWALVWEYRRETIKQEIMEYDADILCVQEVDAATYDDFLLPIFEPKGYQGFFWPKTRAKTMSESERQRVDGCVTLFKTSSFKLLEQHPIEFNQLALKKEDFKKCPDIYNRVMTRDHIAIVCFLEHVKTGNRLILANAHLHWDPLDCDVKLVQTGLMLEELERLSEKFVKVPFFADSKMRTPYPAGNKIPLMICGDFNSTPDSGVYQLLSQGSIPGDHPDMQGYTYGKYTEVGINHRFPMKSSYSHIGELSFTNRTPGFTGAIDYLWYSTSCLNVMGLIGEVDKEYMSKVVGFPNAHFPSDHISIFAQLQFRKNNN